MIVSVDKNKCTKCGICISRMKGYCITSREGFPELDSSMCNTCQKCVAVCPHQAISVNGVFPEKIRGEISLDHNDVYSMLERRRSTKSFKDQPISDLDLQRIVSCAKFAPNQNKNISVHVFTRAEQLNQLEAHADTFLRNFYRMLFGIPPLTWIISLFVPGMETIKKKMEYGLRGKTLPENTQAVIIVSGNKRVPVTESSAHYVLASMMFYSESLKIGSCLMDSIYLALRTNLKGKKALGIKDDVLGAMVLGYSSEGIRNIPRGYEVPINWN